MSLFLVVVVVVVTSLQLVVVGSAALELRSAHHLRQHRFWRRVLASPSPPRITVLMPAFNEEVTIVDSVQSSLSLTYPDLEVVVVDDGSVDRTLETLIKTYELVPFRPIFRRILETAPVESMYRSRLDPRLVVVRKANGGKADALNTAINIASGELVCSIDADTLVSEDSLQQLVVPFLDHADVVAVGGTVRVSNGGIHTTARGLRPGIPTNLWAGCQLVEYTRAFLIGRLGWNRLGGNLIISGAFGVFSRAAVLEVDGYALGSVGEDMDLVVRLRRHGYENNTNGRIDFSPEPVAWTEAPERILELRNQRDRWFRGLLDVLIQHRKMIGNPRYRSAGLIVVPYFVLVEALGPFLEAIGIILLLWGIWNGSVGAPQLGIVGAAYGIGVILSMITMMLDDLAFSTFSTSRDRARLLLYVLAEQFIFRFATIWWRIRGTVRFLRGRSDWGSQNRRGLNQAS